MALKVVCDRCMNELNAAGGILFGPPDDLSRTSKRHLCVECFDAVLAFVYEDES